MRLAGADPDLAPLIDPNYLDDDHDVRRMVAGLDIAREIGAIIGRTHVGRELAPGDPQAYVKETVTTYFHPVGTCRAGSDAMAVVDPYLQVHGVAGLRVADASIMPSIVSANTNATVLAIAERAADLITGGNR